MTTLHNLIALDYLTRISSISTSTGLHDYLASSTEVKELRRDLMSGSVTNEALEQFVRNLLASFRPGIKFGWDPVIAAVAVALIAVPTHFASKFLEELAGIRVSEMPLSPRVAGDGLKYRLETLPATTRRDLNLARSALGAHPRSQGYVVVANRQGFGRERFSSQQAPMVIKATEIRQKSIYSGVSRFGVLISEPAALAATSHSRTKVGAPTILLAPMNRTDQDWGVGVIRMPTPQSPTFLHGEFHAAA